MQGWPDYVFLRSYSGSLGPMACIFTVQQIGLHLQIRKHKLQQEVLTLTVLICLILDASIPLYFARHLRNDAMLKAQFGNRHVTSC